jgi:hypothetical protein
MLRKALAWRQELDSGAVATQAVIARRKSVTRARVTQEIMFLRLAQNVQETILGLTEHPDPPRLAKHRLLPVARIANPQQQVEAFEVVTQHRL